MLVIKRIVFSFLCVLILSPYAYAGTFTDVANANENYRAIEYLAEIATVQGYDDGTFKPDQSVNRAELMKILVAGQGIDPDADKYKNCFNDVKEDWYAKYVCYAKDQNWVAGYADGNFKPAQVVNKVEAAKMVVNIYEMDPNYGSEDECLCDTFSDVSAEDWFAVYLDTLFKVGVISSLEEGLTYDGADEMTRGSVAEYIFRSLVVQWIEYTPYTSEKSDEFIISFGRGDLVPGSDLM